MINLIINQNEFREFNNNNPNKENLKKDLPNYEDRSKILPTSLDHQNKDSLASATNTNQGSEEKFIFNIKDMITETLVKTQVEHSTSDKAVQQIRQPLDYLIENFYAVIAGDTEYRSYLKLRPNPKSYREYKKVFCDTKFVTVQLASPDGKIIVFEHPDMGVNLLPSFDGQCVISDFLGFKEVEKPKKQVKTLNIAYLFYFASFDIFGLFRDKNKQIEIAKQLLGGRVLRETSFPNALRTGVYIEIPIENGEGFEIREIALKLFDAKGYTPAGVRGLFGTMNAWGVEFNNKDWLKYFDISKIDEEYTNTIEMVEIEPGVLISKHDCVVNYCRGDVYDLFKLYNNIHFEVQNILNRLGIPEYNLKNFQTIGNATNQIGIAAIMKQFNLGFEKEIEIIIAKYLYLSSGYALLDECHGTIEKILNIDGGFCKNLKPTHPIITDLTCDDDLKNGYNSAMSSLPYCIGIPCVISYPKNSKYRDNFWKVFCDLSKKNDIKPNTWVARVKTKSPLSFKQDLIFSKIFGKSDYEHGLIDDGEGFFVLDDGVFDDIKNKKILARIPDGAFQLLNNEIIDGIITHDILQVILNYWTKKEQKELWSKLEIECMIFYKATQERSNKDFVTEFDLLDNSIIHNFDSGRQVTDNRKTLWTTIDTNEGWMGTLGKIRSLIKDEMNVEKDTVKKSKLNASQNGAKCINNSGYGVSGSAFYQTEVVTERTKKDGTINNFGTPKMGNMVFAHNTTARIRVAAWAMSKGLNLHGLITDGGAFNINHVWNWNWSGLNRTQFGSDYLWMLGRYNTAYKIDPKRQFKLQALPVGKGKDWVIQNKNDDTQEITISNGEYNFTGKQENWNEFDNLCYQHVKNLFGELDIFKYDIIKFSSKDIYKGAAFQSQANYYFQSFFNNKKNVFGEWVDYLVKARGYNLSKPAYSSPHVQGNKDDKTKFEHTYVSMMQDIYYHDKANIYLTKVFSPELLGVDDFNQTENKTNDYIERGFLPHSPSFRSSQPSPISLSMFKWNTRQQYEKWVKKVESWDRKTHFGIELLFLSLTLIKEDLDKLTHHEIIEKIRDVTELSYSEIIERIQTLIDDNTDPDVFDERIELKKEYIKHPQLLIEESYSEEVEEKEEVFG